MAQETKVVKKKVPKLGAKPGVAILKFWQGSTEIMIRTAILVVGIVVIASSSVALDHLYGKIPDTIHVRVDDFFDSTIGKNYRSLINECVGGAALALGVSLACVIAEALIIIMRFINFGLINYKIKTFLIIDITIALGLSIIFFIGAVLGSVSAAQWRELISVREVLEYLTIDLMLDLRDALAATSISSFLCLTLLVFLAIWVSFFLKYNWNAKLISHHSKVAPTGH